ncbi:farnesyl-pyrophosphate synthetase [Coniophora puteana RWD-64-598 SS2]|uniref:(2E,6E)-farnesyl diphosphate synthase n=1 Tax=Coniophora puteana (strain RWD-64-598) TaxID=741705 RepID=A0A5M3MEH7_CONPW|nr:farnesyl-pyrophosphate synthetase [Coniophora puteana RWD-64-598 SS2]EIW77632.1 farnesyl-pyrophosphate synthetase [Coniophora puteana RWD-64-598 SS2]
MQPTNKADVALAAGDKKKARRARFQRVFETMRDELIAHMTANHMPDEAVEWYRANLEYNVPGGKLNRGMSVPDSAEVILGRALTDDEYFKAALLGWMIELLQAFFLVSDDMMDDSTTRRGQPCWYRKDLGPNSAIAKVGNIAINDSFMLEGAIYHLLKKHFRAEPYYVDILELFQETTFQTEMGQLVDLITAPEDNVDLSRFNMDKYKFIVRYKTAYYSFYLPVALAMRMTGVPDTYTAAGAPFAPYETALKILIDIGEYFQVQDDFLDFHGTEAQIGKRGTDIVDNKCSWCVNTALGVVSPAQRKVLDEHYGRKNLQDHEEEAKHEREVKRLYGEIELPRLYREYEERIVGEIRKVVATVPVPEGAQGQGAVLRPEVFTVFLDKIVGRSK